MKFIKTVTILLTVFLIGCTSQSDDVTTDTEKPSITLNYNEGFPKSCDELRRGLTYTIRAKVSDNLQLASYAIDIHHNFDHHTHSDQDVQCTLDPIKTAQKPLIFVQSYSIPNKVKTYEISQKITIPNDIDLGDYHCQISVLDITGWQRRTSVDIKIKN